MILADPREAVAGLAACAGLYLLGVRHHSPALAAAVPALLDAFGAQVVCVELPTDFQPWLAHLADPGTVAPVALAGAGEDGRLGFYPFADFSPELAAIRWARERGAEVRCCDLPLADPGWTADGSAPAQAGTGTAFADALTAAAAPAATGTTCGTALSRSSPPAAPPRPSAGPPSASAGRCAATPRPAAAYRPWTWRARRTCEAS